MAIERHEVGPRMSKAVVHGNTVYLAGIVADNPKGKSEGADAGHSQADRRVLGEGRHRQEQALVGQHLDHRHGQFRRDECGLGCLGGARQYARARDGRGAACRSRLQGRNHGGCGEIAMSAAQPEILAIFNDCRAGREDEFNAWFQGEHLQKRLPSPVFCSAAGIRRFPGPPAISTFILSKFPRC